MDGIQDVLTWLRRYEKGTKEIGISEIADLLGVTTEALRKYEEKDILQPIRNERGYRQYSSWDLAKVVYARQLRGEGFSLEGISDTLKLEEGESYRLIDMIEAMQEEHRREIAYRQKLVYDLEMRKEKLLQSEKLTDQWTIEQQPALHCCVYMVKDALVKKSREEWDHVKEWIRVLPFCKTCFIATLESNRVSCLVLTEEEIKRYELHHLVPDFIIPQQFYVTCNSIVEYDLEQKQGTSIKALQDSRMLAENTGIPLGNYVVSHMIRYAQYGKRYRSFLKRNFPILQEKMA